MQHDGELQPSEHVAGTYPVAATEHLVRPWLRRLLHACVHIDSSISFSAAISC